VIFVGDAMNLIKIRKIVDCLTLIVLIILLCILPLFVLFTYKTNQRIVDDVNEINTMFLHLESEHKTQQQLLYYDLEFKRIEFNCYLSKENPAFLTVMQRTLENYAEYIANDNNLTAAQKKQYMNDIGIIEQAVDARTELTQKLLEYNNSKNNNFNK
jgi:Ca2+/Na+ antiporter